MLLKSNVLQAAPPKKQEEFAACPGTKRVV
jgi:hypothetical protein